jgi:hypothetical protein
VVRHGPGILTDALRGVFPGLARHPGPTPPARHPGPTPWPEAGGGFTDRSHPWGCLEHEPQTGEESP